MMYRKLNPPLLFICLLSVIYIFPVYWMFIGAFKVISGGVSGDFSIFLPTNFTLRNFRMLFKSNPVVLWMINSFIVAGGTTLVVILTNTMAGYSFAKKVFPGKNIIFIIMMATLMLPRQVLIVPLYIIMGKLHLTKSYLCIMLPAMAWPVGIFLMRQFMQTIPKAVIESAVIDGCSEFRIFFSIILPLSKPAVAALSIFTFISVWGDFLWQYVIISSKRLVTMPVGVANLQFLRSPDYGLNFAGAVIAAIPMIIIFLLFQKYFTKGITLGAVKG